MANNVRINPETSTLDYYFPMEVTDDSVLDYAREYGLEAGWARLGFRKFKAVFVPCRNQVLDSGGHLIFDETPEDVQHQRYLELVKGELAAQDQSKQDGRCQIPDGRGSVKRCPCRIPNPEYIPGGDKPKTLPVRCEGCKYEPYKQAHTTVVLSALDHEDADGEMETFEIAAPRSNFAADRYEQLRVEFVAFVRQRNPKLAPLAELLTLECTKSEAGRELGDASSTVTSRAEKLKALLEEFLDGIVTL